MMDEFPTMLLKQKNFRFPTSKYLVGDVGYSNSDYLLFSDKSVLYHLNEQKLISLKPANVKELSNLRHACLRNIIELVFDMIKRRFQIFNIPRYSQARQINIVYAAMGLYNFIKSHPGNEKDIYYTPTNISDGAGSDVGILTMQSSSAQMNRMKDRMAAEMWDNYQIYLTH